MASQETRWIRKGGDASLDLGRSAVERLTLLLSDLASLALALYLFLNMADMAMFAEISPILVLWMQASTTSHFIAFFTAGILVLFWFWVRGHYSKRMPFWEELGQVFGILITGFLTELGLLVLLSHAPINWTVLLCTWVVAMVIVPLFRFYVKQVLMICGLWRRDMIIVGLGENGRSACAALRGEPLMGYRVRWFGRGPNEETAEKDFIEVGGESLPVIDLSHDTEMVLESLGNPQVLVAVDRAAMQEDFILELGAICRDALVVPSIRGLPLHGSEVSHFFSRELFMLHIRNNLARRGPRIAKQVFDCLVAALLLLLLSPAFIIIFLLIRRDGGRALYGHTRIGTNGHEFKCLKFRSMVVNADVVLKELLDKDAAARVAWEKDFKLKDDPRITGIGSFLRRSSLDELPQLINVLKGEMSLVGPRPIVRAELERYGDQVGYYLQVKPGITGLWQVSGRNDVDYATRIGLDAWYVKNWSLWTDIVILLKTFRVVMGRIGAY